VNALAVSQFAFDCVSCDHAMCLIFAWSLTINAEYPPRYRQIPHTKLHSLFCARSGKPPSYIAADDDLKVTGRAGAAVGWQRVAVVRREAA
jgi:hypothetical protein